MVVLLRKSDDGLSDKEEEEDKDNEDDEAEFVIHAPLLNEEGDEGGDTNLEKGNNGDDEDGEDWDCTWIPNCWFTYKLFGPTALDEYKMVLLLIDKGFDKEGGKKRKTRAQAQKEKNRGRSCGMCEWGYSRQHHLQLKGGYV